MSYCSRSCSMNDREFFLQFALLFFFATRKVLRDLNGAFDWARLELLINVAIGRISHGKKLKESIDKINAGARLKVCSAQLE